MCKLKRKLFLSLVLLVFIVCHVSAHTSSENTIDLKSKVTIMQLDLTRLSKNLNENEQKKNKSLINSPNQENQSMNQFNVSTLAQQYLESARNELNRAKILLMDSNNALESTKKALENCQKLLTQAEEALKSNKEDTSVVIKELGELYNEYLQIKSCFDELKTRYKHSEILMHTMIAIPCIVMDISGLVMYCNGDKNGLNLLWCGLGIHVTSELVYCGGKFIFKFW